MKLTLAILLLLTTLAAAHTDPSGQFEYAPPPAWVHDAGRETWNNSNNSGAFNVAVIKTDESRLEAWAAKVVSTHRDRWDNVKQEDLLLGGQKAKHIRGSKAARGHTTRLDLFLCAKGKTGVVLTFVTQRGEDPAFAQVVSGVTRSFRWR